MHRISLALTSIAVVVGTTGCWSHHYEAQKAAFANEIAERCAAAAQPAQQIIILPAGADAKITPPPGGGVAR